MEVVLEYRNILQDVWAGKEGCDLGAYVRFGSECIELVQVVPTFLDSFFVFPRKAGLPLIRNYLIKYCNRLPNSCLYMD